MQIHDLIQGSPEWLSYRAQHFNASDAPAMMGCSPYKNRTQLLHEMHTGLTPEVDAGTQRRFDDGHRFEALARPLAEKIIGEDLFPVVGSLGQFSASFDGLTMAEDTAFEHKSLNDELRGCMKDEGNGYDLPLQYQVQMEQQLMVSGAERVLFMASKWEGDTLIESRHCWYASDPAIRQKIVAGWMQFEQDMAAYQPEEAPAPAAVGHTPETLPALRIEVTGMVTASNLADYKAHALAVFAGINRELKTDQQFADADKVVKWCGDVETRLAAAKQHALSQTESIDALFRTIDDISAEARRVRLELDKLVKARKEAVRGEIVADGVTALREHIVSLNQRLGKPYMPTVPADFGGAVKGRRTVASLQDAVDTELARAKIDASSIADRIQVNLTTLRELASAHAFLFADTAQIVLKANDDLTVLVKSRISEHQLAEQKRLDAEREKIRAEEQAKAEKDARDKMAREAEAQRQADAATVKAAADAAKAAEPVVTAPAAVQPTTGHPIPFSAVVAMMPPTVVKAMRPEATAAAPDLRLGQICERLGFTVTADFLRTLGFEAAGRDRSAVLFHERDYPFICNALIDHLQRVRELQAA